MPADTADVVSVIVTTKNSQRTLESCLASVRRQTYTRLELIVVDNGSTDATRDIAGRYCERVLSAGPERSAQRNHGAAASTGTHLLFIDSDMILQPAVVADALATLRGHRAPATIIPEVSAGKGFWTQCRILERSCYAGDDSIEAARLYTREAFCDAGGFDLDLTGGEDWDLSRRVAGGKRLPRCRARITHDEGEIRLREAYRKRLYYAAGYLRYQRKHRGGTRGQSNPLLRTAYLRHGRRLAAHPILSAGLVVLKGAEAAAVLRVAAAERWRNGASLGGANL